MCVCVCVCVCVHVLHLPVEVMNSFSSGMLSCVAGSIVTVIIVGSVVTVIVVIVTSPVHCSVSFGFSQEVLWILGVKIFCKS